MNTHRLLKTCLDFKRIVFFFILLVFVFSSRGVASGFKYFKNYTPEAYDHHPQNWAILQDMRGMIYVGNQAGLLEFDGVSWRILYPRNWTVRSLAVHDNGTIYIGGNDEIGFLAATANGTLEYVSLLNHLKDNQKNFSNVRRTHATKEGIYFRSSQFLFRWNPAKAEMNVWEADRPFKASFYCKGSLFLQQENAGLLQMIDDSLQLVPGGEAFAENDIYTMFPFHEGNLLIGTRTSGFYIYDGHKARPFPTEVDDYLKKKFLYHGIRLSGGDFALATLQGGLVIIDDRGKRKHIFHKASGLQDEDVKFVYQDSHRNLWLALNKGISKIEYASPFTSCDDRAGLSGIVLSVVKHRGNLYAGTTSGLFYRAFPGKGQFTPVPGITSMCWSLLSTSNSLLAAASHGVFQVQNNSQQRILQDPAYVLHRSRIEPNRVWVGTKKGFVSLYLDPKKARWKEVHKYEHILHPIRYLVENKQGSLWLGTLTKGVIKVDFPGDINYPVVTRYDTSHGLPDKEIGVFWAAGHVMFTSEKGLFRFHKADKVFIPDTTLGDEFANGSKSMFRIAEDKNKTIWFHSEGMNYRAVPGTGASKGTFVIRSKPFLRIPIAQVNAIYPDPDGKNIWFASRDGLIQYDTTIKKDCRQDFSAFIRKVQLINDRSLVFGGFKTKAALDNTFGYKDRNLRFRFAAPFFEDESSTTYQVFLEGNDDGWSGWTKETQKDYTNLHAGSYTFRVRAKNVYGNVSREAVFQFKVLPPWYLTWWAFSIYALSLFLAVYLIVKWRSRKLVLEKQQLEQIVTDRTNEIESKKRQLEDQSEKLKEMDRIKSRFFANISHEFRTPLTLIMGPLEQRLADCRDQQQIEEMQMMLRNSRHLLNLINQLLDLSKLESGRVQLQAAQQDIIPFLKGLVYSFESLAEQKELELTFLPEQQNIFLYFDAEKFEKVIVNLIANAIKFTSTGGKVTVTAAKYLAGDSGDQQKFCGSSGGSAHKLRWATRADATERSSSYKPFTPGRRRQEYPAGYLEIKVSDTGIGIPGEELAYVFDRFYQAGKSTDRERRGTGIGLALAKELVELHHGDISVYSREGKGSEFTIRLPLGKDHLKHEDIQTQPSAKAEFASGGKEGFFEKSPPLPPQKTFIDFKSKELVEESEAAKRSPTHVEPLDPSKTVVDFEDETPVQEEIETAVENPEKEEQEKDVILVVEDNPDMRKFMRSPLEPHYTVVEAENGKEGIEKAKKIIPDLIVSDIMMPELDGYELCDTLKKDVKTSHIPIVMLTAKASEQSVIQGLQTGADDYITKPFNTKILLTRIKNLIDLRRGLQEKIQRELVLQPTEIAVSSVDQEFMKELKEAIEKNLSDEDFGVDELAKVLYMSRATVNRKIRAITGESTNQFIQSYRLKRAAQLLKENFGNVTEVSFEVGFSSSAYFTKCFREKFQQPPSSFLNSDH